MTSGDIGRQGSLREPASVNGQSPRAKEKTMTVDDVMSQIGLDPHSDRRSNSRSSQSAMMSDSNPPLPLSALFRHSLSTVHHRLHIRTPPDVSSSTSSGSGSASDSSSDTSASAPTTSPASSGGNDKSGVNLSLPVALGVIIPVAIAVVGLIYLHRRHVKRLKVEDANDPHKSLDFGWDPAASKTNVKKGRKSHMFARKPVPQHTETEYDGSGKSSTDEKYNFTGQDGKRTMETLYRSHRQGHDRGLSMDMGDIGSPYLLPPGVQGSRESMNSMTRTIHSQDDRYRPVTTYLHKGIPGVAGLAGRQSCGPDGSDHHPNGRSVSSSPTPSQMRRPQGEPRSSPNAPGEVLSQIPSRLGDASPAMPEIAVTQSRNLDRQQAQASPLKQQFPRDEPVSLLVPAGTVPGSYPAERLEDTAARDSFIAGDDQISGPGLDQNEHGSNDLNSATPTASANPHELDRSNDASLENGGARTYVMEPSLPSSPPCPGRFPEDTKSVQSPHQSQYHNLEEHQQHYEHPAELYHQQQRDGHGHGHDINPSIITSSPNHPNQTINDATPLTRSARASVEHGYFDTSSGANDAMAYANHEYSHDQSIPTRGSSQEYMPEASLPPLPASEVDVAGNYDNSVGDLAGVDFGYDINRLSLGVRPLPPDDPTDNPEQRANRIRSFYKEYFDDSRPDGHNSLGHDGHGGRGANANTDNYYEDYDENYLGDGAAIYDEETGQFVTARSPSNPNHRFNNYENNARQGRDRAGYEHGRQHRSHNDSTSNNYSGYSNGYNSRGPRRHHASTFSAGASSNASGTVMGRFGPTAYGGYSGRSTPSGPASRRRNGAPPPKPSALRILPTPHMLREDAFAGPIDFAPPRSAKDRQAGRPESPRGGVRPYSPAVRAHTPLVTSYDDLAVMPSPHSLRKSGTFTGLDFAPPPKFRNADSAASDAGSIRSNRSAMSARSQFAVRSGANRISRIPQEIVGTKQSLMGALKPQWNMHNNTGTIGMPA